MRVKRNSRYVVLRGAESGSSRKLLAGVGGLGQEARSPVRQKDTPEVAQMQKARSQGGLTCSLAWAAGQPAGRRAMSVFQAFPLEQTSGSRQTLGLPFLSPFSDGDPVTHPCATHLGSGL